MPKRQGRSTRSRRRTRRRTVAPQRGLRASAPEYVPMSQIERRSSEGINSLLREINTRRRRSLGERRRSR